MKTAHKIYLTLCLLLICTWNNSTRANDSSYYGSGNQLIPLTESDISVQKEILSIEVDPNNDRQVNVSVYYEFFNPGKAKKLTVGFEAMSPEGDVNGYSENGEQPYMSNFTITVNNKALPYSVAIVKDSVYYQNGVFNAITQKELNESDDYNYVDFFYVYHFDTTFEPGLNIVEHSYTYELSGSVMDVYSFNYVLSAAMRWGNKQIDDFTLNIDMGPSQYIAIPHTFFDDKSEWTIEGIGRYNNLGYTSPYQPEGEKDAAFFIKEGRLVFKKKNFKPKGELYFHSPQGFFDLKSFNYKTSPSLPYNNSVYFNEDNSYNLDEVSEKILRNLPFAYRGYVFKDPVVQKYFEQQLWYFPDKNYAPDFDALKEVEQDWITSINNYQEYQKGKPKIFDYKRKYFIDDYKGFIETYTNKGLRTKDEVSKKILRNLPFAYRGYVFTDPNLKGYFDHQQWYKPNLNYVPELDDLPKLEREWVERWSSEQIQY